MKKFVILGICAGLMIACVSIQAENTPEGTGRLLQPQPPAVLPVQNSYVQQVQVTSQKPQDPDYGPEILKTFFGQLLPGLAKMAMGTECESPHLQSEGIQQFSTGIANFAYLVSRKPTGWEEFSQDKQALNDFFHVLEIEQNESTQALRKFASNLTCKS